MSFEKPLVVDWKGLKKLGWPYSRTHTWRLMQPTIARSRGSRLKGTYVEWVEPNPNLFPVCRKLGKHPGARSCPPAWCNWRWDTAFAGKSRADQLAIAGRLTVGSSLNGAMVSSVM